MSRIYDNVMYWGVKLMTVPWSLSAGYAVKELTENGSNYSPEQLIFMGGAAVLTGVVGIFGLFAERGTFGLESRLCQKTN